MKTVSSDQKRHGTEEKNDPVKCKKEKISNYIFRICSAIFILTGIIFALYESEGLYETAVFILFFGFFVGGILGAVAGYMLSGFAVLLLNMYYSVRKSNKQRK